MAHIEHMAMYVTDLEAARDFFVRYLDAQAGQAYHNPQTGFRSYFLSFDTGARLEIMTRPCLCESTRETFQTGYAHIAFSLGSTEAVDALTERLVEAGYELLSGPRTTGDGYYESCLSAFEGNIIELSV